jgi:hypothetical protein
MEDPVKEFLKKNALLIFCLAAAGVVLFLAAVSASKPCQKKLELRKAFSVEGPRAPPPPPIPKGMNGPAEPR